VLADYFTEEGWEPEQERYESRITDWLRKRDEIVKIKFLGDRTATQQELKNLLDPKFGFRLEAYDDGRAPPEQTARGLG